MRYSVFIAIRNIVTSVCKMLLATITRNISLVNSGDHFEDVHDKYNNKTHSDPFHFSGSIWGHIY